MYIHTFKHIKYYNINSNHDLDEMMINILPIIIIDFCYIICIFYEIYMQ